MPRINLTSLLVFIFTFLFFSFLLLFNNHTEGWSNLENSNYFMLVILLAVILFLIFNLFRTQREIYINGLDKSIMLFVIYILLQGLLKEKVYLGSESHITLFVIFALYLLFKSSAITDKALVLACFSLVVVGVLAIFYTVYKIIPLKNGFDHLAISSLFSNSGVFAGYLASIIPLAWGLRFITFKNERHQRYIRGTSTTVFILMILTIVLTYSRAAYIAILLGSIIVYLHHSRRKKPLIKYGLLLSFLFLLATSSFVLLKPGSTSGRILIWDVSMRILSVDFWSGIGYGQFGIEYLNHQSQYFLEYPLSTFSKVAGHTYFAFNEPLHIVAELGIIGLLISAFVFWNILRAPGDSKQYSNAYILLNISKLSIIITISFGMFSYPLNVYPVLVNMLFHMAIISNLSDSSSNSFIVHPMVKNVLITIGLITCLVVGKGQINNISYVDRWKHTVTRGLFGSADFKEYDEIYPYLSKNGDFLYNYGAVLSENGKFNKSIEILNQAKKYGNHIDLYLFMGNNYKELGEFENARNSYLFASNMVPNRFTPKYLLFTLFKDFNKNNEAIHMAEIILDMEEKIASPISSQMKLEAKQFLDFKQN